MNVYNFAWGYLYPFLWDVIHAAGYGSDSVDNLYNWLTSFQGTIWESILVAALVPPIALWLFAKNLIGGIQGTLDQVSGFINGSVAPLWGWVVSTLQAVANGLQHVGDTIWSIVWQFWDWLSPQMWGAVNALQGQIDNLSSLLGADIQNALAFVTTQIQAVQNLISTDIQSALAFVTTQIQAIQTLISTDIQNATTWVTSQLDNLQSLLSQISGNIETWVSGFVNGVLAQLAAQIQPLFDFLSWWNNHGKQILVEFVNNPGQFVLDLIADAFIDWAANLIAKNW